MIRNTLLWIYRGLYCAFLGLYLVGLLLRLPIGESLRPFEHPLFYAFIGSIAFAIFSAIAFTRTPEWLPPSRFKRQKARAEEARNVHPTIFETNAPSENCCQAMKRNGPNRPYRSYDS